MAISKNDIDLIDKFLRNRLSEGEFTAFNERMKEKEFAEELAFKQDVKIGAKRIGRASLKADLQQLEKNRRPKKEAKTVSLKPWLLAAASILLLVMAFFLFNSQQVSSAELYAEYYAPYPNVITEPIVKGEPAKDKLSKALQQYELKNYEEAIKLFDELPDSDSLLFYHAITSMELNDFALAASIFKKVLTFKKSSFKTPSLYYLGLCALQINNVKTAQDYFTKVSQMNDNPKLAKQAEEILRKLNE